MPTSVAELLQEKPKPVTAVASEPLLNALQRMIEHDYSQIPVVDGDLRPVALLSTDSISRAVVAFGAAPDTLRVLDAMDERIETCRDHEDLLDVLDRLRTAGSMIVLDSGGKVDGIITTSDTTEYFRRKAQDIMWVQDVEETVKQYVLAAFADSSGALDDKALQAAIVAITPSNAKDLKAPFRKAVLRYIELSGGSPSALNDAHVRLAFDEHILQRDPPKSFDRLTLGQYIELLLHKERWSKYEAVFKLRSEALRKILLTVLSARNDLAHFRTDISRLQRSQIRQCRDWLNRHEEAIESAFVVTCAQEPGPDSTGRPQEEKQEEVSEVSTMIEFSATHETLAPPSVVFAASPKSTKASEADVELDESRYSAIGNWLREQPSNVEKVSATFGKLDGLLEGGLPGSAREHRAWWGNVTKGHTQSRQWLDNGWLVKNVSMHKEQVTFVRSLHKFATEFISMLAAILRHLGSKVSSYETVLIMEDGVAAGAGKQWRSVASVASGRASVGAVCLNMSTSVAVHLKTALDSREFQEVCVAELGNKIKGNYNDEKGTFVLSQSDGADIKVGQKNLTLVAAATAESMLKFRTFIANRIVPMSAVPLPSPN